MMHNMISLYCGKGKNCHEKVSLSVPFDSEESLISSGLFNQYSLKIMETLEMGQSLLVTSAKEDTNGEIFNIWDKQDPNLKPTEFALFFNPEIVILHYMPQQIENPYTLVTGFFESPFVFQIHGENDINWFDRLCEKIKYPEEHNDSWIYSTFNVSSNLVIWYRKLDLFKVYSTKQKGCR